MIKRANKITALLIAATSIMTLVPAMAADTVRLGSRDGHVYQGVSFKDGKYGYYGYRTDDDNTGIYYNNGSRDKDTLIKDAEDYELDRSNTSDILQNANTSEGIKYGDKYIIATEGGNNDEYLVDLTTGKISDTDTPEDQEATAKSRLISALKKVDRYNQVSDSSYNIDSNSVETSRLFKGKFGEIWYQYITSSASATLSTTTGAQIQTGSNDSFGQTTGAAVFTGFVNENGKYIDASYTANLKVYNERKQKSSIVEKFGKVYRDEALKVNLKGLKALAQNKDYIYALANVEVLYYGKDANGNYVYDDNASTTKVKNQYFIQKISKARGETTDDGAYLPKNVQAWQIDGAISGLTATYESDDDRTDAAEAIINDAKNFSVINDVLYVTTTSGSKVKVWKMKFKTDKIELNSSNGLTNDGNKVDTYVVIADDNDDTDYDDWTIDTDGNTWVLNNGEIKVFEGTEFKTKYKSDRGFDRLDVYDSNNLMAWDSSNDGAYTTVREGKQQTIDDSKVIDPNLIDKNTIKTGWNQSTDGSWNFYDSTGAKVVNNWVNVNGTWYFLKADGSMASGWQQVNGTWYFFNPISDGTKGAMKTGWANDNGTWYYLNSSGGMQTGWVNDNGTWYYMNSSGAMQTGWINLNGTWYYLNSSGAMQTGWINLGGTWYYLYSSGAMAANTTISGYTLSSSGALV